MRALIVSYAFPPVGGAGVQRMLKLVKYLPRCGVTPTVLTARDPSVPVLDASLARELPSGLEVIRARTFEPRYAAKKLAWQAAAGKPGGSAKLKRKLVELGRQLLAPDPQVLWQPSAQCTLARRLLSNQRDDVVLISGPPFSQFLLAALARLHPKVGVVLDYRDEWTTTSGAYEMAGSRGFSRLLERAVLRCAHVITTATEEFRSMLLSRFSFLDPWRVIAIPNGYDPEDFVEQQPAPSGERCLLSYVGTVFRLTSARGLLDAVRLLQQREPELLRLLDLRFAGRIVETELDYFEGSEALGVTRLGYLEHGAALEQLARSHLALCILDEVDGVERIYPAKIFEIMRLRRPCLALTPEGALASLVRRHRLGDVAPPRDVPAIASLLAQRLRQFRDGVLPQTSQPLDIERFDRRRQAEQFADALQLARKLALRAPSSERAIAL